MFIFSIKILRNFKRNVSLIFHIRHFVKDMGKVRGPFNIKNGSKKKGLYFNYKFALFFSSNMC